MGFPRRRLTLGAVIVLVSIVAIAGLRLAWEWRQALSDVDAMIVPTVSLPPTATPAPAPVAEQPSKSGPVITTVQPTDVPPIVAAPDSDEPINILLLGSDTRPDQGVTRTDAMILVHINPASGRVSLLSLPRDLWVQIPGFGHQRINAAYPIGEKQLGPGYGGALAKETLSGLVGVPVQHFLLVDFEGFKKVIDTIGGITIDVPKAIDDPSYPTDDYQTIAVHFNPGPQHLDGEHALIYARTRHADSDFGRNQRQQQVLMAIFQSVRDQGLLSQLTNLDDYTGALRDYVRTDISRSDMLRLARMAGGFKSDSIQRYAIGPDMVVGLEQPATFAADPKALRQVVAEMTGDAGVEAEP
jgi:LCP family protein required for cell wall assembly